MKQETYNKLKLAWKVYEYIMYALIFTIGLIALTFGAVYLGRKACEPNIQEVTQRGLKPKKSFGDDNPYYVYQTKAKSFYSTLLDYDNNTNGYKSYWDMDFSNRPQEDSEFACYYYLSGDFYLRFNDTLTTYNTLRFYFLYEPSNNDITLEHIYVYTYSNGAYSDWTAIYGGANSTFTERTLLIGNIRNKTFYHLVEHQTNGLLNYYFNLLFDSSNSATFEFTEDYNFARLTSEVVTSERLIPPYNNQYNGDPLDEHIYYYLKYDFVSNGTFYRGVFLKLSKPGLIYKDGLLNVNYYGSLSQLQVVQVSYILNLPTGSMPSGDDIASWYNNESNYDVVCNKHVVRYDKYTDGQGEHNVPVYDYKAYDWVNDAYRVTYIVLDDYNDYYSRVCYPRDNTMWSSTTYSKLTLYQVLNNGYSDYDYYTSTYNPNMNNHLGDVFTLISGAFGGLVNLFYIQVIPGLTLGVLLLAPLVVTIIIVVLRLVKK